VLAICLIATRAICRAEDSGLSAWCAPTRQRRSSAGRKAYCRRTPALLRGVPYLSCGRQCLRHRHPHGKQPPQVCLHSPVQEIHQQSRRIYRSVGHALSVRFFRSRTPTYLVVRPGSTRWPRRCGFRRL